MKVSTTQGAPNASASAAEPAAPPESGLAADLSPVITTYTVKVGDNLTAIAHQFGTDAASLQKINDLTPYSVLRPGQVLTVLRQVGYLYTVESGESMATIASRTGVTVQALEQTNDLGPDSTVAAGVNLIIPKEPPVAQPLPAVHTYVAMAVTPTAGTGSSTLIWPVHGIITSPFGWRDGGKDFHHGIDIGVPIGTPVAAACSGKVILANWDGGYGKAVEIDCYDGLMTLYAHNSAWNTSYGALVTQGQIISFSGMTGNATGPHVHFGVQLHGVWQNPMNYLP